jgi:hypothetical protein
MLSDPNITHAQALRAIALMENLTMISPRSGA